MTKIEIQELKLKVIELGKQGFCAAEIEHKGICSRQSANKYLKSENIFIDKRGGKNAKITENPFLPRTCESDYWVGMLLSDGNISQLKHSIKLSQGGKNKDHMLKYHKFLKYIPRLYDYKDRNMYLIVFGHKEASDWLINIGITPAKCHDVKLNIPFNWDIVRGYFDGDGGFLRNFKSTSYFSIKFTSSSLILLQQLQNFLLEENISSKLYSEISKKYKTTIFRLNIKGNSKLIFCTKMYHNATIYMDRKKEMWDYYAQVKQGELLRVLEVDNQQPNLDGNILEGSTTNDRVL